jgi:hypothetical protein
MIDNPASPSPLVIDMSASIRLEPDKIACTATTIIPAMLTTKLTASAQSAGSRLKKKFFVRLITLYLLKNAFNA